MKFYWFYHYFLKIDVLEDKSVPRAVLDRSWANLGPQKGQNGTQHGTQNGTKNDPKNHQNFEAILGLQKASIRNLSQQGTGSEVAFAACGYMCLRSI